MSIQQKKVELRVANMAVECGQSYYLVKYKGESESYKVKMYDFQKREKLPKKITCICTGKDKRGRYIFEQDRTEVLYQLYEEECEYTFLAIGLMTSGSEPYLLLKDDYGFNHKLYNLNYDAYLSIGKNIDCVVEALNGKGELVLSCKVLQPSNTEILATPKDLELFENLRNFRLKASEIFQDPDYINVWRGIIDKYPDSAHFIYEFLQNADDALATEVTIILEKHGLAFKHNGKEHFSVSEKNAKGKDLGHINSITAIGNSTKTDNKIGKFGVGFKSVFTYTDMPEIFDDYFRFRIENYMVPNLIKDDHPFRKPGETLFYIPFKNPEKAHREIKKKLESLDNPILFLRNLNKITWFELSSPESIHIYTKTVSERITHGTIKGEFITLNNCDQQCKLWLFTRSIAVKGNGDHNICIGYYINDKGDIDTARRPYVYCFFPTKEKYGVCMIAHAPFELVDSRQNVKNDSNINAHLSNSLANLAADSLEVLRKIGVESGHLLINDNLFDIIPVEYDYDNDGIIDRNHFYKAFIQKLKIGNYFLTREGKYVGANNAMLPNPINLAEFISDTQLTELCLNRKAFIAANITTRDEAWTYLTEEIEVEEFTSEDLASSISKRPVFMPKQEDAWLHRLYSFLKEDAIKLWRPNPMFKKLQNLPFRSCPIIKTTKGTFVPPYRGEVLNVFLASISTDETLNIVNPTLLENNTTRQFFNELGIKEVDESVYIEKRISRYKDLKELKISQNIEDIEQFYIYAQKLPYDKRGSFIQKLRENLTLQCKQDKNILFHKVSGIYSDKWADSFFKGCKEVRIMNMIPYEPLFDKYGKSKILDFLYEIGLRENPEPRTDLHEGYDAYSIPRSLSEKQRAKIFFPDLRPTFGISLTDYVIDGFKNAVSNNLTPELSKNIWSWLCDCQFDFEELICRYQYTNDSRRYRTESTILMQLKATKWLYGKDNKCHFSSDLTWDELETLGYKYNKKLITLLSIQVSIFESLEGVTEEDKEIYRRGKKYSDLSPDEEAEMDACLARIRSRKKKETQKANDFPNTQRDELSSSQEDMFATRSSGPSSRNTSKPKDVQPAATLEEKIESIEQNLENEKNKLLKREELKAEVDTLEKYSYQWFLKLLQLEYNYSFEEESNTSNKAINISFQTVEKEKGSDKIYVLKNPSRLIPLGIEEIGGLEIHFSFNNQEERVFAFEVASVRDYTLRVKAAKRSADLLSAIDWKKHCTGASISIGNPVELVSKLMNSFMSLGFADDYNMKENLGDNLQFIFGPPGTGKTTYLANEIVRIMTEIKSPKILVLTPTNKACDVLARKITEITKEYSWLARFKATGDEYLEELGIVVDADSKIYERDCCVISTMARLPYDGFNAYDGEGSLRNIDWDYIIVDEASMIPLAQIAYTIYNFTESQIIIAGDPMQIAPIVREERWKKENIYTMVHLDRFDNPVTEPHQFDIVNLSTQYRSIPAIGRVFSEYAYDGKLSHHRDATSQKKLTINGLNIKPINFITFRVDRTDGIFAPKKLSGSNVHVYSVLLIIEYIKYIIANIDESNDTTFKLGIICPYAAQAQLIDKLLEQSITDESKIQISVGTIHGFQGDECDIIFTVLNPPLGLQGAADKVFVNDKHILNVAVSRARDYLFIFMPHKSTKGFDNLREIIDLGYIACQDQKAVSIEYTSDKLEEVMFDRKFYIENNTFMTSHQMANVYTEPEKLYEVRIDEQAVDIQVNPNLADK